MLRVAHGTCRIDVDKNHPFGTVCYASLSVRTKTVEERWSGVLRLTYSLIRDPFVTGCKVRLDTSDLSYHHWRLEGSAFPIWSKRPLVR